MSNCQQFQGWLDVVSAMALQRPRTRKIVCWSVRVLMSWTRTSRVYCVKNISRTNQIQMLSQQCSTAWRLPAERGCQWRGIGQSKPANRWCRPTRPRRQGCFGNVSFSRPAAAVRRPRWCPEEERKRKGAFASQALPPSLLQVRSQLTGARGS